jgi:hypothetical protein
MAGEGPEDEDLRRARREARERARDARRRARERRKERVLHTRISDPLAEDIRRLAEELRVPVSNLVRNVLEEAFSVASQVGEDVGDLLDDVLDRAGRASEDLESWRRRRAARQPGAGAEGAPETSRGEPPRTLARAFPSVRAWQPVVLNAPGRCARTGQTLAVGDRAWLGVDAQGSTRLLLAHEVLAEA